MEVGAEALVEGYEQMLWRTSTEDHLRLGDAVAEHDRLAAIHTKLVIETDVVVSQRDELQREVASLHQKVTSIQREATSLSEAVDNAERRRAAENLASFEMVRHYELGQRQLAALVSARDTELELLRNTKTLRYTTKLRGLYGRLRRRRVPVKSPAPSAFPADGTYQTWIELFDTLDEAQRIRIVSRLQALTHCPTISVIMPVYNPPVHLLRSAVDSVRNQIYQNWSSASPTIVPPTHR